MTRAKIASQTDLKGKPSCSKEYVFRGTPFCSMLHSLHGTGNSFRTPRTARRASNPESSALGAVARAWLGMTQGKC